MSDVASRDLRNNTRSLLDRVEAGESITIKVDGRPVASLQPVERRNPASVTSGLADTSVFIALESGRDARLDLIPDRLAVSVGTIGELRAGVLRTGGVAPIDGR